MSKAGDIFENPVTGIARPSMLSLIELVLERWLDG
jgi:hypothetical protein